MRSAVRTATSVLSRSSLRPLSSVAANSSLRLMQSARSLPTLTTATTTKTSMRFLAAPAHDSNVKLLKTASELNPIVEGDKFSILYFTATWCGPCRQIAPVVEDLSKTFSGVNFVKIDIDEHSDVAQDYYISAVPTFLLIQKGHKKGQVQGADPRKLKEMLDSTLAK